MTEPWRDPRNTLGVRCLLLAELERAAGVKANPYGKPNTGPRVREYLAGCLRDIDGDGAVEPHEKLRLVEGNWCAAFQSWLLEQCLLPGETRPHLYRAGVVEMELDAKRLGLFHPIDEIRRGVWSPNLGDVVIWDRSDPKDPTTAWHRHTNRYIGWTNPDWQFFWTIGGNENRTITKQLYLGGAVTNPRLLGFISYFQKPTHAEVDEAEQTRLRGLVAAANAEIWKAARGA